MCIRDRNIIIQTPHTQTPISIYRANILLLNIISVFILSYVAALGGGDVQQCVVESSGSIDGVIPQTEYYYSNSSHSDTDIDLPRQHTIATVLRIQSQGQRQFNAHKNNFDYQKSGKVYNVSIDNIIFKRFLILHLAFIKPDHRFISLGKLII